MDKLEGKYEFDAFPKVKLPEDTYELSGTTSGAVLFHTSRTEPPAWVTEYNYPQQGVIPEKTEDSETRKFESGAVRDSNEGKSRPDLISPYFTNRLGHRLAYGAKKYKERNWEMGIPSPVFLESLERHLVAYKMGLKDEDHLGAIAFNIMGLIHNEEIANL